MTYDETLQYIHSNYWMGSKPGLSRTRALLQALGNPQDSLRFIHVAGTNGKGSFCAMLSQILTEGGYKIGLYTSPYILRFNERMKINGEDIEDDKLIRLVERIRPIAESLAEKPTEFELITALAMLYFEEERCDLVVLECGMGGRLDSTNVITTPILSVITGIAMDHTAFLGDTIEKIAEEKAGIIKKNVPILYCGGDDAERVIRDKAKEVCAPYYRLDTLGQIILNEDLNGTCFSVSTGQTYHLPLLGKFQAKNALHVLNALPIIAQSGFLVSEKAITEGFGKVRWPARFEIVSQDPLILCDGAHNPEGVDSAIESVKRYFPGKKLCLVTGCMKDKDFSYMAKKMSEVVLAVFCFTPSNPRSLSAEELADTFRSHGVTASAHPSADSALKCAVETAQKNNCPILCLGSLYMYGEIRNALKIIL